MKKELNYFSIEGEYGGNQSWFHNIFMNIGGCAAATACDSCIYFAREFGLTDLYPFDSDKLTKKEYLAFSNIMRPFLKPRLSGIKKLSWFIEGFENYIDAANRKSNLNVKLEMKEFVGERSYEDTRGIIIKQLDEGYPVPFLMLKHKAKRFDFFEWHWFLLTGYEEVQNDLIVTAATYGKARKLPLKAFWNTGYKEKGGLIIYKLYQ